MINTITRSPRVKFLAKILDYIFGVGTSTARQFDQYRSLSCGGIFKIRWRTICFIFMIKIADTYRNINRGHMEQVADGLIDPKIPYIFNITQVNGTTIISEIPKIHTFLQLVWGCKIPSQQQPMWSTRTGHYKSIQDHSPCNSSIGRVFRPPLWWWWKMAALPLPAAILDDLIPGTRKWGHPRWRPEAEGPPFSTTTTMGVEKLSPGLGWRHFRRRHLESKMAAPQITSGGRWDSGEILRKGWS